jgi:hypothetical protein
MIKYKRGTDENHRTANSLLLFGYVAIDDNLLYKSPKPLSDGISFG